MIDLVRRRLAESARVKERTADTQSERILAAGELVASAVRSGGKVLICGNGGSASDAHHLATELVVRLTPRFERAGIAALNLASDAALLTACGNDYGFDRVFSRQVEALARAGDVVWGITTSGKSPNVVLALEAARRKGARTLLFSAGDGGRCAPLADVAVLVPSTDVAHVQEAHIACGHVVCELVERLACGRTGE